jgi:hypothetical protein
MSGSFERGVLVVQPAIHRAQNRYNQLIIICFTHTDDIFLFYTAQPDLSMLSDLQADQFADTLFPAQNTDLKAAG